MKVEVFKLDEAEYLVNMLHNNHISYTLNYLTSEHQIDGRSNKWSFEFDEKKVVLAFVRP